MRILLDSHVALWWLAGAPDLGATSRRTIEEADVATVSVVTPWELGIKQALGKLTMPADLVPTLRENGFSLLPITPEHAERAPALPAHHRDPFDRMLVAQAQLEGLLVVTADPQLRAYDVGLLDARH